MLIRQYNFKIIFIKLEIIEITIYISENSNNYKYD